MTHEIQTPVLRPSKRISWKVQLEIAQATIAECKDSDDQADRIKLGEARRIVQAYKPRRPA